MDKLICPLPNCQTEFIFNHITDYEHKEIGTYECPYRKDHIIEYLGKVEYIPYSTMGLIVGVFSIPRQGKTIMLVYFLTRALKKGVRGLSNFRTCFTEYINQDYLEWLIHNLKEVPLKNCMLLFDEIQEWFEKRGVSLSERARYSSYMVWQSGKNKTDIYYSAQQPIPIDTRSAMLSNIDFRLDYFTNIKVFCKAKRINDLNFNEPPYRIDSLMFHTLKPKKISKVMLKNPKAYFNFFDTTEIILYEPSIKRKR